MKFPVRVTTCLAWRSLGGEVAEGGAMGKLDDAMSPASGRRVRAVQAAGERGLRLPKSKKERPASKGRVHKGRTRG